MKKNDPNLLDDDVIDNAPEVDNTIIVIARFTIVAVFILNLLNIVYMSISQNFFSGPEALAYSAGLFVSQLLFCWFAYYNFKQVQQERKTSVVKPVFRRPFIILAIAVAIFSFAGNYYFVATSAISLNGPLTLAGLSVILQTASLLATIVIIRREFQHLKMV